MLEIDLRYQYLWEEEDVFDLSALDPPAVPITAVNSVNILTVSGNLTLFPTASALSVNVARNTLQGNIALSPTAPSSARTTHVFKNSLQGNISFSSNSPDVQSGSSIIKSPGRVDVLLSPTTPTISRSVNWLINAPQGNLVLSAVKPTIIRSIQSSDLLLTTVTPLVAHSTNRTISPARKDLLLSAVAPIVAIPSIKNPLSQNLALSSVAPTVTIVFTSIIRNPLQGNLARSSAPPTVVTTSSAAAPVITRLRTYPAQTTNVFWNLASGDTTSSSEVRVNGTSSNVGANANVFRGGVLQGSTVTDGSGNWKFAVPAVPDGGPYNLTASIDTSPNISNTWTFSTQPSVSVFTNVPGGTITSMGRGWTVESAAGRISNPNTHTLRFELHQNEQYPGDFAGTDRCSIHDTATYNQGTTVYVTFQFLYEAGTVNDAGQRLTHLEMRNVDADLPVGIGHFTGKVIDFAILAEKLSLKLSYCPTSLDPNSQYTEVTPWTSGVDIVRGQWYRADLIIEARNDSTGICQLWIDDVQVLNYLGPIGFGPYRNFWRAGLYRGTQVNTQSLMLKNFLAFGIEAPAPPASGGLITSFTTAQNGEIFIDGRSYINDTAGQAYSITSPDDHTLRYEVRTGDHWTFDSSSVNRSESDGAGAGDIGFLPFGTITDINYRFRVEAGGTNTAAWFVVGQMHNDDKGRATTLGLPEIQWTSPIWAVELLGEKLSLVIRYCPTNLNPTNGAGNLTNPRLWTSSWDVVRGQFYSIRVRCNAVNDSTGYIQMWVDGVQVVNYNGPVGYGPWGFFWCFGLYREANTTTFAATYQNMTLTF